MNIKITARHFKAPDRLKKYIENEVERLNKFFDNIIECDIVLDYIKASKSMQSVEMHLSVSGQVLSVKETSDDMFKSIDVAVKKLERQLKKYKGRTRSFNHKKAVEYVAEENYLEEE